MQPRRHQHPLVQQWPYMRSVELDQITIRRCRNAEVRKYAFASLQGHKSLK